MIVLITGGAGMLASALQSEFCTYTVHALDKCQLNITSYESCYSVLKVIMPDIIFHTAAYTNVDGCELYPKQAELINTIGTENICKAMQALKTNASIVYFSSTGIYGVNKTTPYSEDDIPCPTTIHHKTKYDAEKLILDYTANSLVVRTGWLYGGSISHAKNFIYKRALEASKQGSLACDALQIGNPTFVNDVARQIKVLLHEHKTGLYNCVGEGYVSRLGYVKEIIKCLNIACQVRPASQEQFKRLAPVSSNESALNARLTRESLNIMRPWQVGIQEYTDEIEAHVSV